MRQLLLGAIFASVLWGGAFAISFAVVEWRSEDTPIPEVPIVLDTRAARCDSAIGWWEEVRSLVGTGGYEDTTQAAWSNMNNACHDLAD